MTLSLGNDELYWPSEFLLTADEAINRVI